MDYDSLIAIAEDLEYLSQWGSDISNADIRRGKVIPPYSTAPLALRGDYRAPIPPSWKK